ncbi:S8 family serine peptidase [Seleniivibrio woodruffii]|uniref:S8 family serine peptidase n=1 Tax=Seleniivibrio woodruffii TaxID=1078050 RepID=UPI0026F33415|nr:S8 family serine peptidase [Seleniivibrio woodruffii]
MNRLTHKLRYLLVIAALALLTVSCGGGESAVQNEENTGQEASLTENNTEINTGTADIEGRLDAPEWAYSYISQTAPEETDSERGLRVSGELETILSGTTARSTGTVPVIIRLKDGFVPEGLLNSKQKSTQRTRIETVQNKFITKFRGKAKAANANPAKIEGLPLITMNISSGDAANLAADSSVYSIEEDRANRVSLAESSPLVEATAAWSSGYTGSGVYIAILDTGVDKNHPFLAGRVASEACYYGGNGMGVSLCPGNVTASTAAGSGVAAPSSVKGYDHGTHVAGIAAGTNSSYKGVAPAAQLISVQVFTNVGGQALAYDSDIIKGLQRVLALSSTYNIASVNMSLGSGKYTAACDTASMKTAIDNLRSAGIATVIAAGNEAYTNAVSYPGCISTAVTVGSTADGSIGTIADTVSSFSNSASMLDLLAPGQYILSSVPGTSYGNKSGTSMAAPHVAGAFAVLKSASGASDADEIENALKTTGKQITDPRNSIAKPRILVNKAISSLGTGTVTVDITPSGTGAQWRIGTGAWKNSGESAEVYLGTYKISFSSVSHSDISKVWITPETVSVSFSADGENKSVSAAYTENTRNSTLRDFNLDSKSDLVLRNISDGSFAVHLIQDKKITSSAKITTSAGAVVTASAALWDVPGASDSNGDGKPDLLIRHKTNGTTGLWTMDGQIRTASGYIVAYDGKKSVMSSTTWAVAGFSDMNGDGKSDIIFRNKSDGSFYIMMLDKNVIVKTGYAKNASGTTLKPTYSTWAVAAVADVNGDKKSDIILRNASDGSFYIYLMNGSTVTGYGYVKNASAATVYMKPSVWLTSGAGDTDGDGRADIILRNKSDGSLCVITMNSLTAVSQGYVRYASTGKIVLPSYSTWNLSDLIDVNGDGKTDMVFRNKSNGNLYVYTLSNKTALSEGYLKNASGTTAVSSVATWASVY